METAIAAADLSKDVLDLFQYVPMYKPHVGGVSDEHPDGRPEGLKARGWATREESAQKYEGKYAPEARTHMRAEWMVTTQLKKPVPSSVATYMIAMKGPCNRVCRLPSSPCPQGRTKRRWCAHCRCADSLVASRPLRPSEHGRVRPILRACWW